MKTKIISLSLYEHEIAMLDAAVARRKAVAIDPSSVNRSTVLREYLIAESVAANKSTTNHQ